jgi:energy-coupling factor transporter ATP-binding protein EcfA2
MTNKNINITPQLSINLEGNEFYSHCYINACNIFKTIPSVIKFNYYGDETKYDNFLKILKDKYKDFIYNCNTDISYDESSNSFFNDKYEEYILSDKLILYFNRDTYRDDEDEDIIINTINYSGLYYNSSNIDENTQKEIDYITEEISKCYATPKKAGHFYTIASDGRGGLKLDKCLVNQQFKVDLELNYGEDFINKYNKIYNALKEKNKGMVLLYGSPGTGKSSFLRYLINVMSEYKTIIYVPSYMMFSISNPEFATFIKKNKKCILILEDAESVLQKRDGSSNDQAVSNILNLTDGLLNDSLKIQIIATFNSMKDDIDQAFLRSGRLIEEHEFLALNAEQANKVAISIGKLPIFENKVTLAQIYDEFNSNNKIEKIKITKTKKPAKKVGFVQN